jgi:hypothetical protein
MGGLGNQMFQYAFGLYTAMNNNTVFKIDISSLGIPPKHNPENVYRNFELNIFDIDFIFTTPFENELYCGVYSGNILRRGVFKFIRKAYDAKLYIQNNHIFEISQLQIKDNTCIIGRWQSELYFKPIENEIRKQFKFKKQLSEPYLQFKTEIENTCNATCVHIRRTDYVTHSLYSKILGALPDSYYKKAIKRLNEIISSSPKLFIFSDDIKYAKSMFNAARIDNECIYIQTIISDPHDELQLMTLCRHFIISNSTYSWWGAWLSNHQDKIAIAPQEWSIDPVYSSKYIIPESYYRIS